MQTRTITPAEQSRLRTLNLGAAALHLACAIAVIVPATDFAADHRVLSGRAPGTPPVAATNLIDLPTGLAVAGFLILSFLAHLIVGTVWFRTYISDLSRKINRARWVEYSLSSTLMIVIIAQLVGISDVTALIGIAAPTSR